jgi:precorrin-6B methylase 2
VSVSGKNVLDVGAGCGETAYFYFSKGARKVICVEPNVAAVECLTKNAARHSWNVEVIPEPFKLEIVNEYHFDFMKMDGEGCEKELLQLKELPCTAIVESHSPELTIALTKQFGAKTVATLSPTTSLLLISGGQRGSD